MSIIYIRKENDDELQSSQYKKQKYLIDKFTKSIKEYFPSSTLQDITNNEFKYFKINIENLFEINGYVKIQTALNNNNEVLVSDVDIINQIRFKSFKFNISVNIFDICSEIGSIINKNAPTNRTIMSQYLDTKDKYMDKFIEAMTDYLPSIFNLYAYTHFDTIHIKKTGNLIQTQGLNTNKNIIELEELESKQLKNEIIRPQFFIDIREFIVNDEMFSDKATLIEEYNRIKKQSIEEELNDPKFDNIDKDLLLQKMLDIFLIK